MKSKLGLALCLASAAAFNSGCNIFSPLSSPSGDAQLLSAARACMDQGDFDCALKNYQALSSSSNDIKLSETAFLLLDQNGADMKAFLTSFGNGGGAAGLNTMAGILADGGQGGPRRQGIYNAYVLHKTIADPKLQNFVKFVTGVALASEILSEAAKNGALAATDIAGDTATQASTCKTTTTAACVITPSVCPAPTSNPGKHLVTSATTFDWNSTVDTTIFASDPTITQLSDAISKALAGLQGLGVKGDFGKSNDAFTALSTVNPAAADCYRGLLLQQGLGL